MRARTAITAPLARYVVALLVSAGLHMILFRSGPWAATNPDQQAQIKLQHGAEAVELTLAPSPASHAAEPEPTQPEPPKPKPAIKPAPRATAEISLPEPGPEPEPEPVSEQKKTPDIRDPSTSETPQPRSEERPEQAGSLDTKGVDAEPAGDIKPVYPRRSRLRGEEGSVTIRIQLSAAGTVVQAAIEKTSGFSRLDNAALKAVQDAEFSPAIKDGLPVADVLFQTFTFKLD